jgi:hypothetical protein
MGATGTFAFFVVSPGESQPARLSDNEARARAARDANENENEDEDEVERGFMVWHRTKRPGGGPTSPNSC